MRLREAVFTETQYLPVERIGELDAVAMALHAFLQLDLEVLESAALLPSRHRAAQAIGLAGREAGGHHRELHHLLLEDRHAERASQHLLHRFARVGDRLLAAASPQVGMHHAALDRAGAHDRHLDHQIVVVRGLQARQHAHLRARLDLEHADGVGLLDHRVNLWILRRHLVHFFADHRQRAADCREHA